MGHMRRHFSSLFLVASVATLLGCSTPSSTDNPTSGTQQGGIASQCDFTHRDAIDPIRFPNGGGESHLHDFFGVNGVRANLSIDYLFSQNKTCDAAGDHSSYWVPTMFEGGREVTPISMAVYLMTPEGVDPDTVVVPPNGLQMVTYKSAWKCSRAGEATAVPQQCPANADTRLQLEFPHCWDGKGAVFREDEPHVVVSDSSCPPSHSVVLPRIVMEVRYRITSVNSVSFSSGDIASVHGDVFFAWDQELLQRDFDACLRRNIMCGVTWSTELGV